MQKTKIDWADFTWNPICGCQHNCTEFECYAKKLHNQRHEAYKKGRKMPIQYAVPFNEIQYFPERLHDRVPKMPTRRNEIAEQLSPNKPIVFVGSMCDMFGDWIPHYMIHSIFEYCKSNTQTIFMFLTKNPKKYIYMPKANVAANMWFGTTLVKSGMVTNSRIDAMAQLRMYGIRTFVSIEPIKSGFDGVDLSTFDFVIVGADTTKDAEPPRKEWIYSINHERIFYKKNIKKYL